VIILSCPVTSFVPNRPNQAVLASWEDERGGDDINVEYYTRPGLYSLHQVVSTSTRPFPIHIPVPFHSYCSLFHFPLVSFMFHLRFNPLHYSVHFPPVSRSCPMCLGPFPIYRVFPLLPFVPRSTSVPMDCFHVIPELWFPLVHLVHLGLDTFHLEPSDFPSLASMYRLHIPFPLYSLVPPLRLSSLWID